MIRMTEEQWAEFLRSTSLDIALMRTRFDEIDEQKIYEKGLRLGKKIGKIIGERSAELKGLRMILQQVLSIRIPMGEEEAELLQQLNGDELLLLSERYKTIKTSEDLAEQVHEIVNQKMNANDQFNQSLIVRSL